MKTFALSIGILVVLTALGASAQYPDIRVHADTKKVAAKPTSKKPHAKPPKPSKHPRRNAHHKITHKVTHVKPVVAPAPQLDTAWHSVAEWSGDGMKQTEPFTITSKRWKVKWSYDADSDIGSIMQIFVEHPGSQIPVSIAANEVNKTSGSDESYVYESGEFTLMMNCGNNHWKVEVLQQGR